MLDPTHAALIMGIAKNLKGETEVAVYSDYLQEIGSPGWLIVKSYPVWNWAVWSAPYSLSRDRTSYYGRRTPVKPEMWSLPWIGGKVTIDKFTTRQDYITRWILEAYAEGRVQ